MRRPTQIMVWALATVLLSVVATLSVSQVVGAFSQANSDHRHAEDLDFHQWMHQRLVFTDAQHAALKPFEDAFEEKREGLHAQITEAGRDLANAVRLGDPKAPEIEQALGRLNAAQSELQKLTLEHFFAMKQHLDPEQAEKLLEWTRTSIVHE